MVSKVKQIGGSWSIDLDIEDDLTIMVNGEEVFKDKMDCDVNIAFYKKRRNKPNNGWF